MSKIPSWNRIKQNHVIQMEFSHPLSNDYYDGFGLLNFVYSLQYISEVKLHSRHFWNMLLPAVKKHADYANEFSSMLKKLHSVHQVLTGIYLPLVITCMGFSCYFAYIHGAASAYTDPGEDWEACYTTSNALLVPLGPVLTTVEEKVPPNPLLVNCIVLVLFYTRSYLPVCS